MRVASCFAATPDEGVAVAIPVHRGRRDGHGGGPPMVIDPLFDDPDYVTIERVTA